MDCEMVGVGPFGLENALARVSIVNFVGDVVLDEFVLPQETVVDWRTAVSGVRKEDMVHAKSFREIQNIVSDLLKDRFLVGHALQSDLSALLLSHPWQHLRDTQSFHPLRQIAGSRRPALRKLVNKVFGIQIQQGEHNSIIDARAPMALYRLYRKQWEGGNKLREPIEVTISPPMSPASVVSMPASTTVVTARSSSPTPSHSSSSSTKSKAASSINSDTKAVRGQTKPKQPDIIISIDKKSAKSSSKKGATKVIEPQPITRKKTTGKTATGTRPKGKGSASANPMSSRIKKSSGSRV
ncbi:3'-5' exonuclease, partial [Serendipita sp. 396]